MCVTREQWPQSGRLRMQNLHLGDKSLRCIRKLEQFWPDKKGAAAVPVEDDCRIIRCVTFSIKKGLFETRYLRHRGAERACTVRARGREMYRRMTRSDGRPLQPGQ
jgi:hypothetical protein